jgi:hypothetical protein
MNDRIKELAEQVVGPSRLFGGEFALMGDSQVEKFATLIIQECANIALREEHDPYECILKHFGVTNDIQTD